MRLDNQLFSFRRIEELDKFDYTYITSFVYKDCTLNVDIGPFKKGDTFPGIVLGGHNSKLIIFTQDRDYYVFDLKLKVKKKYKHRKRVTNSI